MPGGSSSAAGGSRSASIPGLVLNYILGRNGYSVIESAEVDEENGGDDIDSGDELLSEESSKRVDIPEDAYGAAILAFVRDVPLLCRRSKIAEDVYELAVWSCAFAVVLLVSNLVLQCSILMYVYHYVVALDIAHVQLRYRDFRRHVFDPAGAFQDNLWPDYAHRDELCQIAMWNRPFYYSVLFCWSLVMIIEIKKSEELIRHIWKVPTCDEPSQMLIKTEKSQFVIAFTRWTRFCIMGTVGIPKIGISITLLWLGCEWLSATIKFESLVMNTVAMAFIVNIDEILFEAVLPRAHRNDVENIDFLMPKTTAVDEDYLLQKKRKSYRKSLFYMVLLVAFVLLYGEWVQDVLPEDIRFVRAKCQDVIASDQPFCNGWTWYLRGKASALKCFPFPSPQDSDATNFLAEQGR
mmetsp:Transcript_44922/g.112970  ORF Transcript_44922/g.112970 Transcript_44922/m.112970 type:complete len:408 (+) Transcript_44922:43-1266(+)